MDIEDEWFRPAACYLVKVKNMMQKDVAKLFGVNRKRVSRAIERFNETGSHFTTQFGASLNAKPMRSLTLQSSH